MLSILLPPHRSKACTSKPIGELTNNGMPLVVIEEMVNTPSRALTHLLILLADIEY